METVFDPPVTTAALPNSERPVFSGSFEIAGRLIFFESKNARLPGLAELMAGYYCEPVYSNLVTTPDATIRFDIEDFPSELTGGFDRFDVSDGGVGYTDGRTCVFDFQDARIIVRAGEPHQIDVSIRRELDLCRNDELQVLNYAISTALRRCALYELHSGAVVEPKSQRGVLFAGPSGSGKSTLTLQLVAKGWQYLTDDVLVLKNVGGVIKAFPVRRAFVVSHSSVVASGRSEVREAFGEAEWPSGAKKPFMPHDFFPGSFSPDCEPHAIFFPAITDEEQTVVRPLTPSETMIQLIKLCPWSCYDPITSTRHLAILSSLAKQCNGFKLSAGSDLLHDPTRASELILEHTTV